MENILLGLPLLGWDELTSPDVAGAKAYRLRLLIQQGFQVPPFFCIPAAMRPLFMRMPEAEKLRFADQLQDALTAYALKYMPEVKLFSVRTSALAEDGDTASYAGQFKTLLRIPAEGLGKAVLQCWKAVDQEHIAVYSERRQQLEGIPEAGIIIQQMIEADAAGVAFSANPQGILNETVVVCGKGTGDKVVEDKVSTTTYYRNQHSGQYYCEQQPGACLIEEPLLMRLFAIVQEIGSKKPVDIEYAIQGDTLWLLQQRPITTLSAQNPVILDNSNIVESYGGLCTPLTISFASYVYTQVFKGLARRCLPQRTYERYEPLLGEMVNSTNGRMYYQISNWYTVLKFLPMQRKIIPVWQRMMGVQIRQYDDKDNELSFRERLITYGKILSSARGIPRKMDALEKDFLQTQELFRKNFKPGMEPGQLFNLFQTLAEVVLKNWDITLLNDMYAFVFTGLLEREFKKAGLPEYQQFRNRYLAGNRDMESLKPLQAANVMVQDIQADKTLYANLAKLKDDHDVQIYLAGGDAFARRILDYLDLYGDRSHEELKLETQTFRSSPFAFVRLLLAYADGVIPNLPDVKPPQTEALFHGAGFLRRRMIEYYSKKAKLGIAHREASRLNRGRIFGMVRSIFTEIGNNLYNAGLLEHARDVFYLKLDEVFAYAQGRDKGAALDECVRRRKGEYDGFAELPDYSRLVFTKEVFDKHPHFARRIRNISPGGLLRGTPCSQGVAKGEVIVVTEAVQADDVRDKIIVTRTTDPGWVFLLAVAKGVVAEKGSLLSHTAIITRELGLPSVVGVENVTEILKTGDYVRMDGGSGIIEKCND